MADRTLAETRFLRFVDRDGWSFVERVSATAVVMIVAVTDEGKLVLVEQPRPPLGRRVIELPAGLVGDEPGQANEALEDAARRELLEETGYAASSMERLATCATSPGMTNELSSRPFGRGGCGGSMRGVGWGGGHSPARDPAWRGRGVAGGAGWRGAGGFDQGVRRAALGSRLRGPPAGVRGPLRSGGGKALAVLLAGPLRALRALGPSAALASSPQTARSGPRLVGRRAPSLPLRFATFRSGGRAADCGGRLIQSFTRA